MRMRSSTSLASRRLPDRWLRRAGLGHPIHTEMMLDLSDAKLDAPEIGAKQRDLARKQIHFDLELIDLTLESIEFLVECKMPVGDHADLGLDALEDHLKPCAIIVAHSRDTGPPTQHASTAFRCPECARDTRRNLWFVVFHARIIDVCAAEAP